MSVSSHFTGVARRRVPRQQRGRRRVARLLRAAETVIAEYGHDAATMCAIAQRAGSSVGSLYQFFPNKDAVVQALCTGFAEASDSLWKDLTARATKLGADELADRMIALPLELAKEHPAFLALLDLPPTAHSRRRHEIIRERIAGALRARRPRLSRTEALRMASVTHQIVRGCLTLCARSHIEERSGIVEEFRVVLAGYLRERLSE
ncbi:MAG TPA: TetR/AcrR family transcriptional regulator [Candidatus Limnocylindrales bacterium]|nr:TetR/AcrR family transcriptional regulator [Candidatus Limnocylindrales bacterium]